MHLPLFIFLSITIVLGVDNIPLLLSVKSSQDGSSLRAFPDSLDWRTKGVVTQVQDYLDSPYITGIVMVGTIESLHAIATGNLQRGSIARVIDCCAKNISYECIKHLGGICTYDDYPSPLGTCKDNACQPFASFDAVDSFNGLNDTALLPLLQKSTLLVSFNASQQSFSQYQGGVYKERNCSHTNDIFALQLVGYGSTESGELYWIARNNWGKDWGESGYIRILRGENICGIGLQAYQPGILVIATTIKPVLTTSSQASNCYFSLNKFLFIVVLLSINIH